MNMQLAGANVVMGLLLLIPGTARAVDQPKDKVAAEIKQLVGQLGASTDAAAKAKKRLAEIGLPALTALRAVVFQSKDKAQRQEAESVIKDVAGQARKLLDAQLTRIKAQGAIIHRITDESLARLFPAYLAFAVRFRQYPVAVQPRAPLLAQNVFIVDKDGQLDHVTDLKSIQTFFIDNLGKVSKGSEARAPARAWLALWQELVQDGYYKFSVPAEAIKVSDAAAGTRVVARALVKPEMGNKGYLQVTLVFGLTGDLERVKQEKRIYKGIRPKCQATKLLDRDPVVRAMAEQDILVMGKAARDYLDEQRARAAPALRREIDRLWKQIIDEDR